jgi:hypothetical protein
MARVSFKVNVGAVVKLLLCDVNTDNAATRDAVRGWRTDGTVAPDLI